LINANRYATAGSCTLQAAAKKAKKRINERSSARQGREAPIPYKSRRRVCVPGVLRQRVPAQGEVLNITAPCGLESEASFMTDTNRRDQYFGLVALPCGDGVAGNDAAEAEGI
jgi:hypothetical protein